MAGHDNTTALCAALFGNLAIAVTTFIARSLTGSPARPRAISPFPFERSVAAVCLCLRVPFDQKTPQRQRLNRAQWALPVCPPPELHADPIQAHLGLHIPRVKVQAFPPRDARSRGDAPSS
jgi:cell division inhibitor SulA